MAASWMARGWRMAEKRRALGRGLGALIPSAPSTGAGRPVDVFFTEQKQEPANLPAPAPSEDAAPERSSHVNAESVPAEVSASEGTEAAPESGPEPASSPTPSDAAGIGLTPVPGAEFAELDIESIRPNPKQPRTVFDEDHMG